jgi:hypothetical protein
MNLPYLYELLKESIREDNFETLAITAFHYGRGDRYRKLALTAMEWLGEYHAEFIYSMIDRIPTLMGWDALYATLKRSKSPLLQFKVGTYTCERLEKGDVLCAMYLYSEKSYNNSLCKIYQDVADIMGMRTSELRRDVITPLRRLVPKSAQTSKKAKKHDITCVIIPTINFLYLPGCSEAYDITTSSKNVYSYEPDPKKLKLTGSKDDKIFQIFLTSWKGELDVNKIADERVLVFTDYTIPKNITRSGVYWVNLGTRDLSCVQKGENWYITGFSEIILESILENKLFKMEGIYREKIKRYF